MRVTAAAAESAESAAAQEISGSQTVIFEITDTGIGIAPEHISRLMEPFDQIDPSATRAYGGTGLGLALNRALTRAMGATLTVDSTPGQGSTFTLAVGFKPDPGRPSHAGPATPIPAPAAEAPAPARARSGRELRVLLVEDDEVNQKVGSLILRKLGHPFEIAENGQLAVTAARSTHYDVILMDVRMPVMDGLEATRQIRAQLPPGHQPTIVALTANITPADRLACAAAGMDDFLAKPVRAAALEAMLSQHQDVEVVT